MTSFSKDFTDYASEFTDTPPLFLNWSGLFALSVVLGRKANMQLGDKLQVPNIWLVFVGPSSVGKSTPLRIAKSIIEPVCPDVFLAQEWSHEKLIEDLSKRPHSVLLYDEARSFFDSCSKDYASGAMSALTTLFEEPRYTRTTKKDGLIEINDAYVSFCAASTPEWIAEGMKGRNAAILSGFLPRFLFIQAPKTQDRILPFQPPADNQKRQLLIDRLRGVAGFHGTFTYTAEALESYKTWYCDFHKRIQRADNLTGGFLSKLLRVYSHRLAMLCAANIGSFPDITLEAFNEAKTLISYLERTLPDLITNHIVATHHDKERQKIEAALQKRGEMKWSELSNTVHVFGEQFRKQIEGLRMAGRIELSDVQGVTKPATLVRWIGTDGILTL